MEYESLWVAPLPAWKEASSFVYSAAHPTRTLTVGAHEDYGLKGESLIIWGAKKPSSPSKRLERSISLVSLQKLGLKVFMN